GKGTKNWYKQWKLYIFKWLILIVLNLVACNREFESLTHRHIRSPSRNAGAFSFYQFVFFSFLSLFFSKSLFISIYLNLFVAVSFKHK
ncbi:hypothetical protein CGJ05_23785, partial [Vibrio parahaemolyticus]